MTFQAVTVDLTLNDIVVWTLGASAFLVAAGKVISYLRPIVKGMRLWAIAQPKLLKMIEDFGENGSSLKSKIDRIESKVNAKNTLAENNATALSDLAVDVSDVKNGQHIIHRLLEQQEHRVDDLGTSMQALADFRDILVDIHRPSITRGEEPATPTEENP